MMNMKALTIPEIAQALWEVSSVLILTHRRPDGDTAGSAAALGSVGGIALVELLKNMRANLW